MKIKYLGHSSFLFTSDDGVKIVCDPYSDDVGYPMPRVSADAVTVSHHHYDHDCVTSVGGNPVIFDRAEEAAFKGVKLSAVRSFHDDCRGAKRGANIIFKYDFNGLTLCHMGDLGEKFSSRLAEEIGAVDVLLVPVGGNYTIDAAEAKKYVDKIRPNVVIPMHYRTPDCNIDIEKVEKFISLMGGCQRAAAEIELSLKDTGGEQTKVVIMDRSVQ